MTKRYTDEALAAAGIKPVGDADKTTTNGDGKQTAKTKQADLLIEFAAQAKLFHSPPPDGDAFVDIIVNDHRETHPVRGRTFRQWLRHQYFKQMKQSCSSDAMQEAVETLAAKAQFEGEEREIHCRIAGHSGAIYIDVGDATWRAIKITAVGWEVISDPPVRFRRSRGTGAIPTPISGGSVGALRAFCNVSDDEFILLVGYMLAVLRPNSTYPVLVLTGEQGSAKTTLLKFIQRLTDRR
jgi:hypothetical protein